MESEELIINRVTNSGLLSFDLEDHYPQGERLVLDIKDQLYEGLMLKEKDFREFLKTHDWEQYQGKNIALTCSEDAIVPTWAYMLLCIKLEPMANMVVFGSLDTLEESLWKEVLGKIDVGQFKNAKVVIKGCSKYPVPVYAYTELTRLLRPVATALMFGEPCSTVPLYKKAKEGM